MASIAALYRYPVKSMLGEAIASAALSEAGIPGDRAWAVVDRSDGTVASAKHPRKWGRLLEVSAALLDEPVAGTPSPVRVELPDGTTVDSGSSAADEALSAFLGRDVSLVCAPPAGAVFEEVWPDIGGLAPAEFIASTTATHESTGEPVSTIGLSQMAPPGTFFDVAPLHLLTTSTLAELSRLAPHAGFDVRRYRPNVVIDMGGDDGFVENGWSGGTTIGLGADAVASVLFATMRCVMTTLAQGGADPMPEDRATLQAIAAHSRIDLGFGVWACAGAYASVTTTGTITAGDRVAV